MEPRADKPFSKLLELVNRIIAGGRYLNGSVRVDGYREQPGRYTTHVVVDVNAIRLTPTGRRHDHGARVILTPEMARDLAAQLVAFADYAEGK